MNTHRCPAAGCSVQVSYGRLMCSAHWRQVPAHLRKQLIEDWNHGNPRVNYIHTRADAIASVFAKDAPNDAR